MNPFHFLFDKIYPITRFIYERILRQQWIEPVNDQIWLGGAPLYARDYQFIKENHIGAVINIRAERQDDEAFYAQHDINYVQFKVLDMMVPAVEVIDNAILWMRGQILDRRSVYVHCAKGRSRSAILVAAYLMQYENMSLDEAHNLLKQQRRLTNLTSRHLARLREWAAQKIPQSTPANLENSGAIR